MTRQKETSFTTVGNFFVAKSRLGFDGVKYPILVTTALSKVEVLNPDSIDEEDGDHLDAHELLKKKFRDFQKNGGTVEDQ